MPSSSSHTQIDLADFDKLVGSVSTEVSSQAIGGRVLSVSDEWFAPASDLLKVHPAVSMKGQFGPAGALFDGWETRRHNPDHDWVIIKLGVPAAKLSAFDIDTSWFSGNEGPAASVQGVFSPDKEPQNEDPSWESLLPVVPLGPSQRHVFTIPATTSSYTHLRLRQIPDGGIARFRAYGIVSPIWTTTHAWDAAGAADFGDVEGQRDLAHAFNGGRCVYESDKHYGVGANLLLPGRGKDMGDGWETKRSRTPGHQDFVIIKLGAPGAISLVNVDTLHFLGNFPAGVELHAINSSEEVPSLHLVDGWVPILNRVKVGPHAEHFYPIKTGSEIFTHVRMTIFPDGGVKRLRVFGRKEGETAVAPRAGELGSTLPTSISSLISSISPSSTSSTAPPALVAEPLTTVAFAPYGQVIQAFPTPDLAPASSKCTSANAGSAWKYHRLSVPQSSYPEGSGEVTAFSCFRAVPPEGFGGKGWKGEFEGRMFERHAYTTQTFIPMGKDDKELAHGGEGMLVIVAQNGKDDAPDPSTFKAFMASPGQGLTYNTGVWHHSVLTLVPTDFACLETQMSTKGDRVEDCEVRRKADGEAAYLTVEIK